MTKGDNMDIDITGLDKAAVLKALYDNSRPLGMGILHHREGDMTLEQARDELAAAGPSMDFDYLLGRVMKVRICDDTFNPRCFDRDNGEGAAASAIAALRAKAA